MYNKIIDKFKNKNIAILGFGVEGKSTYNFIRRHLPNIPLTIIDGNEKLLETNSFLNSDLNLKLVLSKNYLDNLDIYDIIIKTPGISLNKVDTSAYIDKITSQMELLLEVYKNNCIGITGTKGKSTTSSLIYSIFKDQSKDVYLLGNIGNAVFDEIEKFNDESILVLEMSSHQLEYLKVSPHIGIILNLFVDHLDHAVTVEHYHNCKLNMFKYQNEFDVAIYNYDNITLKEKVKNNLVSKEIKVSLSNNTIYNINDKRKLLGDHNLYNILFSLVVAKLYNLNMDKAISTVNNFESLEYRMQYVKTVNDITYYVDTLATIPEATIESIKALKNVDTLIIGGKDRMIDYSKLIDYLNSSSISNIICMSETGKLIGPKLVNKHVIYADEMEDVIESSNTLTKKNKICLLSPAAASDNDYVNYKQKANAFIDAIEKII